MNTLDSSSAVESSMEDDSNRRTRIRTRTRTRSKPAASEVREVGGGGRGEEEGDPEVWKNFNESFGEVQTVLDRNRALIQQVNENHQSRIPDNMVKNVALIQEINGNITKVVSLYSDLSTNFSTFFHSHKSPNGG